MNVHTYYSLRYGTLSPQEVIAGAKRCDIDSFVLTDINNSTAVPDIVKLARQQGLKAIGGIDFRNGDTPFCIGIARNMEGMRVLNEYLTRHLHSGQAFREAPEAENIFVIWPFENAPLRRLAPYEFVGVRPRQVRRLLTSPLLQQKDRLVMLHSLSFASKEDYVLHRHLRAVSHNCLLSRLPQDACGNPEDHFVTPSQLRKAFEVYPFIVRNTLSLQEECCLNFDLKSVKNKLYFTGSRKDDRALLQKLAYDGLDYRYGRNNLHARERIDHELEIIDEMGFASYFLIAWDMVRYSMQRGYYHVGRGSGANSIVAYCLKITDVDPVELNLYFERFLNPRRSSPPDFDIDYSWKQRDEVIDYLFKRYGASHTAWLGTISTFKSRSVLRELAKVQGLPKAEIDALVRNPAKYKNRDTLHRRIVNMAARLAGYPNMRSVHAGGILISEKPITYYCALDMPPKGFATTQWDMYVAEDIGFEKLDVLSQRGIGHVKEAAEIILENRGQKVDVHDVARFKTDPAVRQRLYEGETIGCFYIESPAMRGLLAKLRCRDYLTLVAASSIIRPGVARSGMMKEYIRRFHHPDSFEYMHPVMEEQLSETYGVMVYQEDVLKVCHHFAGMDLADADVLRRAMSGKFRSRKAFENIVMRFFENCRARGYSESLIKEVWRQVASFAGYAFSKAHSASYAVESFQSLYLKTHYPLEFMVAVINNFGGFYETWVYFNEAARLGGEICLPCVNRGKYMSSLRGKQIYIGFVHVESLERKLSQRIIQEREANGPYSSLPDFIQRVPAGVEQLRLLVRVGAFRFTGKPKARLLWELHTYTAGKKRTPQSGPGLFETAPREYRLPELKTSRLEDVYDEMELIGFPVSMSYFEMVDESLQAGADAGTLLKRTGKTIQIDAVFVALKYVKTVKNEMMHFAAWADRQGNYFDTVHFPASLKDSPFRGHGLYRIQGKVVNEFGHPSLEVFWMKKLNLKPDPRAA